MFNNKCTLNKHHTIRIYASTVIYVNWSGNDLDLWPITWTPLQQAHSHDESLWQVSLKSIHALRARDIESSGQTMDWTTWTHDASTTYCWQRRKKSNLRRRLKVAVQSVNVRNSGKEFQTEGPVRSNPHSSNTVLVLDRESYVSNSVRMKTLQII